MKNIIIILLLSACACETDIDLINDSVPVPIVYCILNHDDTIHNLRLSRAYLSRNAQISPVSVDSLLVKGKVNITIEAVENSLVTTKYCLQQNTISKDSGFFPNSLHWIYQGHFKIMENTNYRLIVDIKDWDYLAFSSIQSLGDFKLIDPSYPEAREIHILDDHNPQIHWTQALNASVYQVGFRLHFKEIRGIETEEKTLNIQFATAFRRDDPGAFYDYTINSNYFFKRIAESIPMDNTLLRQFITTDVYVTAGSESVGFFLNVQGLQDPFQFFDYTNLINGHGIFGSFKTVEKKGFRLDNQSLDTLAYGKYTSQLNFLDSYGHRNN